MTTVVEFLSCFRAERLAARRRNDGEKMEIDAPENGSSSSSKDKFKKPTSMKDEIEEGEVEEAEEIAAPVRHKWKQGTGASIDLSRIRSFAARVETEQQSGEESDEEGLNSLNHPNYIWCLDLVCGVNLSGIVIDDEAEDELHGVLARARRFKQIEEEHEMHQEEARRVRMMLSAHGVIKSEPDSELDEEANNGLHPDFADGIVIDATSEQYKLIGEIPTFGLAGNRNDDVDYR